VTVIVWLPRTEGANHRLISGHGEGRPLAAGRPDEIRIGQIHGELWRDRQEALRGDVDGRLPIEADQDGGSGVRRDEGQGTLLLLLFGHPEERRKLNRAALRRFYG
jgi:hypothetical protein